MKAALITIGDELLSGDTVDTNSAFLGLGLGELGVRVVARFSVPDEAAAIVRALARARSEAELVITTGGLGPTADDITLPTAARFLEAELTVDPEQARRVREVFARRGIRMPALNENQFLRLVGGRLIYNPAGTAPAQLYTDENGTLVLLPGVPREVVELWRVGVRDALSQLVGADVVGRKTTLRTVGVSESVLAERLERSGLTTRLDEAGFALAYLPGHGIVDLRLTAFLATDDAAAARRFSTLERELERVVGSCIYNRGRGPLTETVGGLLRGRSLTLATAESCTAGKLGKWLTDPPGSSDYYVGGVIAYSNDVKQKLLDVPGDVLAEHGAVSHQTAAAMARGALERLDADLALSTTGIAGPGGGTTDKPVGTVYIGLAQRAASFDSDRDRPGPLLNECQRHRLHDDPTGHFVFTRHLKLTGARDLVRRRSVILALDTIRRRLVELESGTPGL